MSCSACNCATNDGQTCRFCGETKPHESALAVVRALNALRIPAPVTPPVTESLLDSLVGDVVGGLAMFREPHCGGFDISDEQLKDRARNIVAGLIGNYRIERLPDEHAPLVTAQSEARAQMMIPRDTCGGRR